MQHTPEETARLQMLPPKIEETDTQLRMVNNPAQFVAGVVYRYYRLKENSVAVAAALHLKPPHVRALCWRLERVAADLGLGTPKPPIQHGPGTKAFAEAERRAANRVAAAARKASRPVRKNLNPVTRHQIAVAAGHKGAAVLAARRKPHKADRSEEYARRNAARRKGGLTAAQREARSTNSQAARAAFAASVAAKRQDPAAYAAFCKTRAAGGRVGGRSRSAAKQAASRANWNRAMLALAAGKVTFRFRPGHANLALAAADRAVERSTAMLAEMQPRTGRGPAAAQSRPAAKPCADRKQSDLPV